jgi:hypothetical protein
MAQRDIIERAFLINDTARIAELLDREPPLLGYSKGFNIAHLAVVTGDLGIVHVASGILADHWPWLCSKVNHQGQTPVELAKDLGLFDIQKFLEREESPRELKSRRKKAEADNPRAKLAIEDEQLEEMYDRVGRKNQQKLRDNANGKPYWRP